MALKSERKVGNWRAIVYRQYGQYRNRVTMSSLNSAHDARNPLFLIYSEYRSKIREQLLETSFILLLNNII